MFEDHFFEDKMSVLVLGGFASRLAFMAHSSPYNLYAVAFISFESDESRLANWVKEWCLSSKD
ncbi:MAG: hypothetical protein MZV64_34745 [Ignavibacteriales bacterium]|nr:hypothetical protein [Ignavibacteriales bacterium]